MTNISRLLIIVFSVLFSIAFLTNCGDDEGGGLTYTGLTTPVMIDENNAESVAVNAYQNGSGLRNIDLTAAVKTDEGSVLISLPYGIALARSIIYSLDQADISSFNDGNISAASMQPGSSNQGSCDANPGSVKYTGTFNESTGYLNMTAVFSGYCMGGDGVNSGVVTNGTMQMSGQINMSTGAMQLTATLRNYVVTLLDTGVSSAMDGTMDMNMDMAAGSASFTMNMLMRDGSTGKTYKVEDFQMSMSNMTFGPVYFSMSGRFFDPDYGYTDIETQQNFSFDFGNNTPSNGIMVVYGASNTKAKLTVLDATQYQVTADTTGNDTYNFTADPKSW